MANHTLMETTTCRQIYRKARRRVLDGFGVCSYCKPHRGENRSRPSRCWKDQTRVRKQYLRHVKG